MSIMFAMICCMYGLVIGFTGVWAYLSSIVCMYCMCCVDELYDEYELYDELYEWLDL
jgi:hypothetical protein